MTPHSVTAYRHRAKPVAVSTIDVDLGSGTSPDFPHTPVNAQLYDAVMVVVSQKPGKNVPYLPSLELGSSGMRIHFRQPLSRRVRVCACMGGGGKHGDDKFPGLHYPFP